METLQHNSGYPTTDDLIATEAENCVWCGETIDPTDFQTQREVNEFVESGLCKPCQKKLQY